MSRESEAILEKKLISQLQNLGYESVTIPDEEALLINLKQQLERFNHSSLSDKDLSKKKFTEKEFASILNHLSKGNIFAKAKTLRDRFRIDREKPEADNSNNDTVNENQSCYIQFFDSEDWNNNLFQVCSQVTMEGLYENRYDVTLLVNGLPLVQIELKRSGIELKEAFNQINRYNRHSFGSGAALYQYIQIFIISNGVNTKYYSNNKNVALSFKQTFFWADTNNKKITELSGFSDAFLNPNHLGQMIARYIVLNETYKILMVLRPYQYYATEAIVAKVKQNLLNEPAQDPRNKPNEDSVQNNGYIWHTTGSGKTLTSFKTSQIIIDNPEVDKVIFVVDRKDLDYQTIEEFNSFREGSIDGTDNTSILIDQFLDRYVDKSGAAKNSKLIVTTIQKLNNAINKQRYLSQMGSLKDKRIVFIFDECHRSQFGETHRRITNFFTNYQMFGFTGTPIFSDNAQKNDLGKRTTKDLFGECLHKYTIVDAIADENVLRFKIEYLGRYREKIHQNDKKENRNTFVDIEVEDIDTKEVLDSRKRLEKIVDYIIAYHDQKTHNRRYSSLFAVSGIKNLITYYEIFKERIDAGKTDLRVATIFTYGANEEDKEAQGSLPSDDFANDFQEQFDQFELAGEEPDHNYKSAHSREKLDQFIGDYNKLYGTSFSTKERGQFNNYFNDISKRMKNREKESFQDKDRLDILLVVNMFLTGFDAKKVNTLYVDKNLKHHGLIQAFSRTNRIINEEKSQGNILCFRNLKAATDEAIALFSNKHAKEDILVPDYDALTKKFAEAVDKLFELAPTVASVDSIISEEDQLKFVQAFRELMRIKNVLTSFSDFNWDDLPISEQSFEDYKTKYLDIYRKVKSDHQKEKTSILEDIDFELELIHRDEINVAYILKLLAKLKTGDNESDIAKQKKAILDLLSGDIELHSKRELIMKFIEENLPQIDDVDSIPDEFDKYWHDQKVLALNKICEEESLDREQFKALIEAYIFSKREPLREDVFRCLAERPSVLQAKVVGEKIIAKMKEFVEVFVYGVSA